MTDVYRHKAIDWTRPLPRKIVSIINDYNGALFTVNDVAKKCRRKQFTVRQYLEALVLTGRLVILPKARQADPYQFRAFERVILPNNKVYLSENETLSSIRDTGYYSDLDYITRKLWDYATALAKGEELELDGLANWISETVQYKEEELVLLKQLLNNHELWDKKTLPGRTIYSEREQST